MEVGWYLTYCGWFEVKTLGEALLIFFVSISPPPPPGLLRDQKERHRWCFFPKVVCYFATISSLTEASIKRDRDQGVGETCIVILGSRADSHRLKGLLENFLGGRLCCPPAPAGQHSKILHSAVVCWNPGSVSYVELPSLYVYQINYLEISFFLFSFIISKTTFVNLPDSPVSTLGWEMVKRTNVYYTPKIMVLFLVSGYARLLFYKGSFPFSKIPSLSYWLTSPKCSPKT